MIDADSCDLFDVLEYISYARKPITRAERVENAQSNVYAFLNERQRDFIRFVLRNYVQDGVDELDIAKLSTTLNAKYGGVYEAQSVLGDVDEIKRVFIEFQQHLYAEKIAQMDAPLVTSVLVAKPEHFGKDSLSNFLDTAQKNTYANFVSKTAEYQKLLDLDFAFRKVVENISQQDDAVFGLLMMRCHSSFLNAIRVLMSCAVVETHILLRSVLEAALYALHIDNDNSLFVVWIKRHDSNSALERCRSQFGYGKVIATLRTKNQALAERVSYLYDTTIDFGAHPNEMAVTSHLNLDKSDKQVTIKANYLTGEAVALTHAFKVTLQVGIEAL